MTNYVVKKKKTDIFSLFLLFDPWANHVISLELKSVSQGLSRHIHAGKTTRPLFPGTVLPKSLRYLNKPTCLFDSLCSCQHFFQSCWNGSSWVKLVLNR